MKASNGRAEHQASLKEGTKILNAYLYNAALAHGTKISFCLHGSAFHFPMPEQLLSIFIIYFSSFRSLRVASAIEF